MVDSAAQYRAAVDSMQGSFQHQTSHLTLPGGIGELTVPPGYRYLDSTQSRRVLTTYGHNPNGTSLGMLFLKDKGQQYNDYNVGIDEVAAYPIGGLVAGKVLAKVGFFAIILKFWELGLLALGGLWPSIKRFFGFGTKEA